MYPNQGGESVDITQYFSERTKTAIQYAAQKAIEMHRRNIDTEHLLWGILQEDELIDIILKKLDLDKKILLEQVEEYMEEGTGGGQTPGLTPRAKQVLQLSFQIAMELGHKYIGNEHVLLGLIKEGEGLAAQILQRDGISYTKARQVVVKTVGEGDKEGTKVKQKSQTPTLDKFSRDLTKLAKEGKIDPVIGRSDEITRVIQI